MPSEAPLPTPVSSREARPPLAWARPTPGPRESRANDGWSAPGDSKADLAVSDLSTPAGESDSVPRWTRDRSQPWVPHPYAAYPQAAFCDPTSLLSPRLSRHLALSPSVFSPSLSLSPSRSESAIPSPHSSPSSTPRHALFTHHPALGTRTNHTLAQTRNVCEREAERRAGLGSDRYRPLPLQTPGRNRAKGREWA
jgi:hypothetical protein